MMKKANIYIFIMFLVFMISTVGTVVFNNYLILDSFTQLGENYNILLNKIQDKGELSISLVKNYNSNGDGFIDGMSCPTNITMSGTTSSGTLSSDIINNNGFIYCLGNYNNNELKIFFNNDFTDFSKAFYNHSSVNLNFSSNIYVGDTNFLDSDLSLLSFTTTGIFQGDNIDDNFDSDNYKVSSTGSVYYPNDFQDDDVKPRKIIYGSLKSGVVNENIFWNNFGTNHVIDNNINNNDIFNVKISDVESGYLYFDFYDNNHSTYYDIKIVEFDCIEYQERFTLLPINVLKGEGLYFNGGYLQNNLDNLSFAKEKTGSEYIFDFQNKDYAIFMSNKSIGELNYQLTVENIDGKGVFINPINDSQSGIINILSNHIIIYDGNFIGENILINSEK